MNTWHLVYVGLWSCSIMFLGWLWQCRSKNAGVVDVLWSACMGSSALILAYLGNGAPLPRLLLALFAGIWGLRLALHLGKRVFNESEDGRYQAMRAHWNNDQKKFLWFFMGQGISVPLLSLPFWVVASNPQAGWQFAYLCAILLGIIAITGEAVADYQLAQHKKQQLHSATCRQGLWYYSRHPNYFFEWLQWFIYVLLAIGSGAAWWITLLGPSIMLLLLFKVSGIPYTEAQALRSKGADYQDYQRSTSIFIPWPPKP